MCFLNLILLPNSPPSPMYLHFNHKPTKHTNSPPASIMICNNDINMYSKKYIFTIKDTIRLRYPEELLSSYY